MNDGIPLVVLERAFIMATLLVSPALIVFSTILFVLCAIASIAILVFDKPFTERQRHDSNDRP